MEVSGEGGGLVGGRVVGRLEGGGVGGGGRRFPKSNWGEGWGQKKLSRDKINVKGQKRGRRKKKVI